MTSDKPAEPIRAVKGTRDLLPPETRSWQKVEDEARSVFHAYNFREIRTPILEWTELFRRSVGAHTDIVTKEMFTFQERLPDNLLSLRNKVQKLAENVGKQPPEFTETSYGSLRESVEGFTRALAEAIKADWVQKSRENDRVLRELPQLLSSLEDAHARGDNVRHHSVQISSLLFRMHESLTLRPEATASVVRAYIEHRLYAEGGVHKLYYMGPMFRRERPQKGRYRQFYQIGAEVLGSDRPAIDAEVLEMLLLFLERLGLRSFTLLLNSVGDSKCRPEYVRALRRALESVKSTMCADCQRRAETNPLRVLDCKVEADQPVIAKLPSILDHLCPECRQHSDRVQAELKQRGIPYEITPRLVRGLDYYTRTTFEITSSALGAQNALLGGGRYDGLSEMLGGPPAPGIGFSIGEDRLVLAVEEAARRKEASGLVVKDARLSVYVAWLGDTALVPASALARELRRDGLSAEISYEQMKLTKAMRIASKLGAQFTVIIGEGELASGRYQVKDMSTGGQEEVESARIALYLKDKIQDSGARIQHYETLTPGS